MNESWCGKNGLHQQINGLQNYFLGDVMNVTRPLWWQRNTTIQQVGDFYLGARFTFSCFIFWWWNNLFHRSFCWWHCYFPWLSLTFCISVVFCWTPLTALLIRHSIIKEWYIPKICKQISDRKKLEGVLKIEIFIFWFDSLDYFMWPFPSCYQHSWRPLQKQTLHMITAVIPSTNSWNGCHVTWNLCMVMIACFLMSKINFKRVNTSDPNRIRFQCDCSYWYDKNTQEFLYHMKDYGIVYTRTQKKSKATFRIPKNS